MGHVRRPRGPWHRSDRADVAERRRAGHRSAAARHFGRTDRCARHFRIRRRFRRRQSVAGDRCTGGGRRACQRHRWCSDDADSGWRRPLAARIAKWPVPPGSAVWCVPPGADPGVSSACGESTDATDPADAAVWAAVSRPEPASAAAHAAVWRAIWTAEPRAAEQSARSAARRRHADRPHAAARTELVRRPEQPVQRADEAGRAHAEQRARGRGGRSGHRRDLPWPGVCGACERLGKHPRLGFDDQPDHQQGR